MSDLRADAATRESATWASFEAAVRRIPGDRWEEEGLLPGWSVRDLLGHVLGWIDRCADKLEAVRAGTYEGEDPTDEEVDAMNVAFVAAVRDRDPEAVWGALVASRGRLLERWRALPEIDERALDWFGTETFEHYDEHLPELERFAG
jgi:hypothetical protein